MSLKLVDHSEYTPKERSIIDQWRDQIQNLENSLRDKYQMDEKTRDLIKNSFVSLESGFIRSSELETLKKTQKMWLEVPARIKDGFYHYHAAVDIKILSSDKLKKGTVKERSLSQKGKDFLIEGVLKVSECMIPSPCRRLIVSIYLDSELTDIFEYDLTGEEENDLSK